MGSDPRQWRDADGRPSSLWVGDESAGVLAAPRRTDWFIDPANGTRTASAPLLLTPQDGDLRLRAHVRADLTTSFDAAALFVHADATTWAKLAMERSPEGLDTIVTVVTRGVSDDANGVETATRGETWLRLSRTGPVYTFHHSSDGQRWSLDRLFTLGPPDGHRVGLSVQSPLGDGLTAHIDGLDLSATSLLDPRDGS